MFCTQCGQRLPDEAIFCPTCGHHTLADRVRSDALRDDQISQVTTDSAMCVAARPVSTPALPFAAGDLCSLDSTVYEVSYDVAAGRWQLEDVADFRKNLVVESDGSLTETRFDAGASIYKVVGSTDYSTADLRPYIEPWNWRDDPITLLPALFQVGLAALWLTMAVSVARSGDYYVEPSGRGAGFAYLVNKIGSIFGPEGVVVFQVFIAIAFGFGAWQSFIWVLDKSQGNEM